MRLLSTKELQAGTFELKVFDGYQIPPYAILSHTWEDEELTLQDMEGDCLRAKSKKGFEKVYQLCSLARADDIEYAWIDTCCIDKTSSEEITEAINSMYVWYEQAQVCYAYLGDVPSKHQFEDSKWFGRGWTLQELIAPANLVFFDETWSPLGDKKDLQQQVSSRTCIPMDILSGETSLESYSVAQRMSWAAKRETTRIEDIAYSLLGLFHIHMPVIYGEGEIAFIRLQEEVLRLYEDHTLFAWRHTDNRGGLLATCPAAFAGSANIIQTEFESADTPPTISSRGIHLELPFMGVGRQGLGLVVLHCGEIDNPHKRIGIYVKDLQLSMRQFGRINYDSLPQVDYSDTEIGHGQTKPKHSTRRICVLAGRLIRYDKKQLDQLAVDCHRQIYSPDEVSEMMGAKKSYILGSAAEAGDIEKLWVILSRSDIEIDVQDEFGRTPMMRAVERGRYEAVKFLLDRGAEVDAKNQSGQTSLIKACQGKRIGIAKLLISGGADLNVRDSPGLTALFWAIKSGHLPLIETLVENGAAIEKRDGDGHTPLSRASENGRAAVVELLLSWDASVDSPGRLHRTPLMLAARMGHYDVAKLLLDVGASIEGHDGNGRNAMYHAARNNQKKIVWLLSGRLASAKARETPNRASSWPAKLAQRTLSKLR
ncbi:hypothetical protein PENSTE_c020G06726 [Penicillium steckii]|uniref:Uncharacterized protein n=1 Tax=Penicillium steckii TaxID=303698 RepID=A0A1V6SU62_9EURO|nr:hypothetical protein PENSTE_c020G06726 [Penicillium steckii]